MSSTVILRVNTPSAAVLHFRKVVWTYYKKSGRHDLPWRPPSLLLRTRLRKDTVKLRRGKENEVLYHILVSEVMLQQTQVERVLSFYKKFIKKFPTVKKLADAPLSEVLKSWQGLGYNRRAKMLHQAAQELASRKITTVSGLEALPGVGPYTACAVAAFAFNKDVIFVETNIRTAVIHHFFPKKKPYSAKAMQGKKVSDKEIEKILIQALPKGRAREWYSALMDYGAHLKHSGISHNVRSPTYTKQSKFAGSLREARGAILRELALGATSPGHLIELLGVLRRAQMRTALRALWTEGLIEKSNENYTLAD